MHVFYEEKNEKLHMVYKESKHFPPHLHQALEMIYVTNGTLELGVGEELYHMEVGDFAIVFPNMIHHYQVFSQEKSKACYMFAALSVCGQFQKELQRFCPENPVIKREDVHQDITNAICRLLEDETKNSSIDEVVAQSYVQVILARSMCCYKLLERQNVESNDIIYQTVTYIARHFKEPIMLEKMARDLGVSRCVLSRVFSGTFHKNLNQYVNQQRLNYACELLTDTNLTITEICLEAGFQSHRTFNRSFLDVYKMTPRQYRDKCRSKHLTGLSVAS